MPITHRLLFHLPYWFIIAFLSLAWYFKKLPYATDLDRCLEVGASATAMANWNLHLDNQVCFSAYSNAESDKWARAWDECMDCFTPLEQVFEHLPEHPTSSPGPDLGWVNTPDIQELHRLFSATLECTGKLFRDKEDVWPTLNELLLVKPALLNSLRATDQERRIYYNLLKMKFQLARWVCQQYFIRHAGGCDIRMEEGRQLLIIPQPGCPKVGQPYQAQVFLANTGVKHAEIHFYANGQLLPQDYYGAVYTLTPSRAGKQKVNFTIKTVDPITRETRYWGREMEFEAE